MSTKQEDPVDPNQDPVDQDPKVSDKIPYDTHKKLLNEKRNLATKYEETARKLKEYEDKRLEETGEQSKLIESLRSQLKEKDSKLEKVVGNFAHVSLEEKLRAEAVKHGCVDVDLFLKAADKSAVQVDYENGFVANPDDMKNLIEQTKKNHPRLFQKGAPKFHDGKPTGDIDETPDLSKLSSAEILNLYKKVSLNGIRK